MSRLAKILVQDCEFSVRAANALWRWRMDKGLTLEALDQTDDATLMAIPNFGRKCLREVREAIEMARLAPRDELINELHDHLSTQIEAGLLVDPIVADLLARLA